MARRKTKNFKIPFKLIGILLFFISSILISAALLKAFFYRYPYFNINRIVIKGAEEDKYAEFKVHFTSRLMGKNIFSQKLSLIKRQIEEELGDVECRAIQRRLPGEIILFLRDRLAIAQLKLGRFYPIDASGMIMDNPSDLAHPFFPVILGLEDEIESPKKGKLCSVLELKKTLLLIERKNSAPHLGEYLITRIKLAKNKTSSFFIIQRDILSPPLRKGIIQRDMLSYGERSRTTPPPGKGSIEKYPVEDVSRKTYPNKEVEVKFDLDRPGDVINVLALLLDKRKGLSDVSSGAQALADVEYIDLKDPDSPAVLETKILPRKNGKAYPLE